MSDYRPLTRSRGFLDRLAELSFKLLTRRTTARLPRRGGPNPSCKGAHQFECQFLSLALGPFNQCQLQKSIPWRLSCIPYILHDILVIVRGTITISSDCRPDTMAAVSGTVDILALAKDAFQLYHVYRDAQDRYRALCEDIMGLESTLMILGNKLVFQGTSNHSCPIARDNLSASDAAVDNGLGGADGLGPEESAALQQLIQKAQKMLHELHARVPARKLPRGLYRLKWSECEGQSIRSRITALNSSIAAFSSSLVVSHVSFSARTEQSQQQILATLCEVLDAVQNNTVNRPLSHANTLVAPVEGPGELHDDVFLQNLIHVGEDTVCPMCTSMIAES